MNSQQDSALTSETHASSMLAKRSTVFILAITCGLAVANVYYNQPLLADIGRSFDISVQQVGSIPTLTQIGYAVGLLFLVPLGDKVERRGLIVKMLLLLACALVATALSPSITWLSVSSLILGFTSIVAHLIIPFVARMTPTAQRGKVIGTLMSGVIGSVLLARAASGLFGKMLGWQAIYWIAACLMIVLAFVIRGRLPMSKSSDKLSYQQLMQSLVHLIRQQPILREAALIIAAIFAAFNAFWVSLVFRLEAPPYYYDSQVAGLFGLVGIAGAIATPFMGRLVDKWGARVFVGLALAISFCGFVIIWIAGHHLMALILGVLILDLGMHAAYLSNQVRVYNLIPNAESRLNTVYMVTNYSGGALGSFLGTYSWATWQWNGVGAVCLSLLVLAWIVHFSGRRNVMSYIDNIKPTKNEESD
ncbi:MFS transporter [Nostocales cyanobacterium HT-58-2]|nr:MFS transporter [Nostocales cyanobacterium HT-58-2]